MRSFDLLTIGGQLVTCTRLGDHADLFAAACGGMGYLGAIVQITYSLMDLRHLLQGNPPGENVHVETAVRRHDEFEGFVSGLLTLSDPSRPEAVYGVAGPGGIGAVHRSRYISPAGRLRRLPIARRPSIVRLALELLMWSAWPSQVMWRFILRVYYRFRQTFVDELFPFTFCMDQNVAATALFRRLGGEVFLVQQTFVIPGSPDDRQASATRVADFMKFAVGELRRAGAPPSLFDVLYLPPETGRHGGGLAVSMAFVTTKRSLLTALTRCLIDLSERCGRLGGHVHLVKDVLAWPEDLAAPHARQLARLFAQKARLDPHGILRNAFFDRVLAPSGPPPSRTCRTDAISA